MPFFGKILDRLDEDRVQAVIPEIGGAIDKQDRARFDRELYRRRNVVERPVGWLKESRRIFSRFETTATNCLGTIHAACIRYYLAEFVSPVSRRSLAPLYREWSLLDLWESPKRKVRERRR